jgi:hypothetical protein
MAVWGSGSLRVLVAGRSWGYICPLSVFSNQKNMSVHAQNEFLCTSLKYVVSQFILDYPSRILKILTICPIDAVQNYFNRLMPWVAGNLKIELPGP